MGIHTPFGLYNINSGEGWGGAGGPMPFQHCMAAHRPNGAPTYGSINQLPSPRPTKWNISTPIHATSRLLAPHLFHMCPSQPTIFYKIRAKDPNNLIRSCAFTRQPYANMASRRQNVIPSCNSAPPGQPGHYSTWNYGGLRVLSSSDFSIPSATSAFFLFAKMQMQARLAAT